MEHNEHRVLLEIGERKVFAYAVDWPGWSRYGRDEQSALENLANYGSRYAEVMKEAGVEFKIPAGTDSFEIVERGDGSATTDFGAPDLMVESDFVAVTEHEQARFERILKACWQAFDQAVAKAEGKELRKGTRGGGRGLEKMVAHVIGAEGSYLQRIGWQSKIPEQDDAQANLDKMRTAILAGLSAKIAGELPDEGPRGGKRWQARYFVRRVAWHVLDHAWEIEDRLE